MGRLRNLIACMWCLSVVIFLPVICSGQPFPPSGFNETIPKDTQIYYLKCNIHYQQHAHDAKASYANWTDPGKGHDMVRVNTPVEFGDFRKGFGIIVLPTRKEIRFEYSDKNMKMSIEYLLI